MLEVLTLLNKCTRVPRQCDDTTLTGVQGIWVAIDPTTGNAVNVVNGTSPKVAKMLYNGNSLSVYESHDVSVGKISTLESVGARIKTDLIVGTVAGFTPGSRLIVAFNKGSADLGNGKLQNFDHADTAAGTYVSVGVVQELNVAGGYIVYEMTSPITVTK